MCQSIQVAITKHKILSGLETTQMYFSNLWMLEVEDQGTSMVVENWGPPSWFSTGTFSLCPHVVEGVRQPQEISFIRTLIPFMRAPPS